MFEKLERMILDLCKEWDRELYDSICDLAYENGLDFGYNDDNVVWLEDEIFTLSYNINEI